MIIALKEIPIRLIIRLKVDYSDLNYYLFDQFALRNHLILRITPIILAIVTRLEIYL